MSPVDLLDMSLLSMQLFSFFSFYSILDVVALKRARSCEISMNCEQALAIGSGSQTARSPNNTLLQAEVLLHVVRWQIL